MIASVVNIAVRQRGGIELGSITVSYTCAGYQQGHNLRAGGRSVWNECTCAQWEGKATVHFNIVNFQLTLSPLTSSLTLLLVVPAIFDAAQL